MGEDLAGYSIRLHKMCEKCKGTGWYMDGHVPLTRNCEDCNGNGEIVKEIPTEQLMQLMQTVAATTASRYIATGGEPD